jgi:putative ABC transport system ATP-binding protein
MLALLGLALRPEPGGSLLLQPPGETPVEATALWNRLDALAGLRSRMIGFVPQTGGLLPFLTLAENILLPLRLLGRPDPSRVRTLAEALDILPALHRLPANVSVGQRQRTAVARALVHAPALVLADEPTASVHPTQATSVLRLLIDAAHVAGAALLVATHDLPLAAASGLATLQIRVEPGRSLLGHQGK